MTETHPLTPFVPPKAKVLLLGSFPPPKIRWKMPFYYPNYNNDMWRIMGLIFYQDKSYFIDTDNKRFKQDLIEKFLYQYGIAISDTAEQVIRLKDNASDAFLQVVKQQDIASLLTKMPNCQTIITTGEKATQTLIQQYAKDGIYPKIGEWVKLYINEQEIVLYRLPSSSRAYPLALAKKAEIYEDVFRKIL